MKKVFSILGISLVLLSSGFFYKSYQNKKEFQQLVNSIDLNDLEGNFLIVKDYDERLFYINESEFNKELTIYLDTIEPKLKYQYSLNSIDEGYQIVIKYQFGSQNGQRKYTLKMAK